MDQNELFETTRTEINEFRTALEAKLGERESVTLDAIKREDSWGDLAQYAKTDSENPELADLAGEFESFGESMQESEDAWGDE